MKKKEKMITDCGGIKFCGVANNDTELVFIIDKSGSMAGYEDDTIGGFNSMIEKQSRGDGKVYVSTVLFDSASEVIHDRVDISKVKPMTRESYNAWGSTALLDTLGDAIKHIKNIHKYARREDLPAHTIFVITTDGMENSSRRYSVSEIRKMIREQSEGCGWEFIFVAANIDAIETAADIGISRDRAANYRQSREGYTECYEAMSDFVSMSRATAPNKRVDSSWKKKLEEYK